MEFEQWLLEEKGLSKATASKYTLVIKNRISDWLPSYQLSNNSIEFEALKQLIFSLDIYKERNKAGNNMYSSALNHYGHYLRRRDANNADIFDEHQNLTSEAERQVKVRLLQAKFRKNLFDAYSKCIISGIDTPNFLIASHIKPWARCNDRERVDPFNGLLLTPNYDRLFDQGFITFKHSGEIIISEKLNRAERAFFCLPTQIDFKFSQEHQYYLEFHQDEIFENFN